MNDRATLGRLLLGAAIAATLFYGLGFSLNEHLRQRRGPWEVTFSSAANGDPELIIRQPALGIAGFTVRFAGETVTNSPTTVRFESPHLELPFGRVKYDDLTYLPGVVTLEAFGHEIELLPRTIYVNRRAVAWDQEQLLALTPDDRATAPERSGDTRRQERSP